ncbi:MAG TPA: glycoside hydrolase family 2 TIM barrel-domain containing protein [Dinghuibacter sp.]|uniref:glycoside hydrolase family 2 protein n=1 Tax=Dinghuibacter sp. TaxID=2024697 RepID=UPI002B98EEF5|nr:sugar-binding domain-containing protein [Dinghuibacter sp.]HTJ12306.1 glycoside hydrolase family 2 TIM barrel-domain containing protein [Dinghuibacter sp.]
MSQHEELQNAVSYLRDSFAKADIDLDFSVKSVELLDQVLDDAFENGQVKNPEGSFAQQQGIILFGMAGYVAEVVIRQTKNARLTFDPKDDNWYVNFLLTGENGWSMRPGQRLVKRVHDGAEAGLHAYTLAAIEHFNKGAEPAKKPWWKFWLIAAALVPRAVTAQTNPLPTRWTAVAQQAAIPLSEYPRPQLRRTQWLCLNGPWDYQGGPQAPGALHPDAPATFTAAPEKIRVPFCPESTLSGIHRKQEINMWYRKVVRLPATWRGKNVLLHFGAVDHEATVFVNGKKAGSHAGGYDGFTVDITPYLHPGADTLVVAAHDPNDGRTPSGKNGPRGDYTFTSGIWQTVWLEPVAEDYIKSIRLTPDVTGHRLKITVDAVGGAITAVALDGEQVVAKATGAIDLDLPIAHPRLWSPDTPFLYTLHLTLTDAAGRVTDAVDSYFGMRDIRLGKLDGVIRPLLNGRFVMQLGLLDQGYWPDGVETAPTDEALASDLRFAKKAGFNLIRKHMKTEPQRFYYWADKLGLFIWQDMPAIWYQDEDTATVRETYRKELKAVIDEHYNSPSIIAWVPFNENWGAFDVREITDWVKAYDPSRLVNGNSGFNNNPTYQKAYGDPGNGDFVDTHIYVGPYHASVPDHRRAASLGEFGGVGLFVRGHMWPVENNAYAYEPTPAALTDRYVLLMEEVEQLMKYRGLSVAIYTQTTDVEHEVNGLLTYDRAVEKMQTDRVRAVNAAIVAESKTLPDTGAVRK